MIYNYNIKEIEELNLTNSVKIKELETQIQSGENKQKIIEEISYMKKNIIENNSQKEQIFQNIQKNQEQKEELKKILLNLFENKTNTSDKTFTVIQGTNGQKHKTENKYPMSQWDRIYKIKVTTQHYEDISDVYEGNDNFKEKTIDTEDTSLPQSVIILLKKLQQAAANAGKGKLTLGMAADITPKNIATAQEILNELAKMSVNIPEDNLMEFIDTFNKALAKILIAFPRKDKKWQQLVLKCTAKQLEKNGSKTVSKKVHEIIAREQEVLDDLYSEALAYVDEYRKIKSTLDSFKIKIYEADSQLISWVKKNTGLSDFKAWYIENGNTKAAFNANLEKVEGEHRTTEQLFHGSPTANWLGILCRGLRITNYVQNGRAMGDGLYFGPYDTGQGYAETDDLAYGMYVGLFNVRVGKKTPRCGGKPNKHYLDAHGYDSYYAGWATVIYVEEQADIYALVQIC